MLSENEPCVRNTMPDCSNLVLRWIVSLLPATAHSPAAAPELDYDRREKDTCYVAKPWCC